MLKRISYPILIFSFLILPFTVFAQEETSEIVIAPTETDQETELIPIDSPFYFLTDIFADIDLLFTFDEQKRIEKSLEYADKKLNQMENLPEEVQERMMERLENRFEKLLEKAEKAMEKANYSEEENSQTTQEIRTRHLLVLGEVLERVPEGQAQESIQKVIDKTNARYTAKDSKIKGNNKGGNNNGGDDEVEDDSQE